MRYFLPSFFKSEDGAVTVDWVVLTAAIVGFAATGGGVILSATQTLSGNVNAEVTAKTVSNGN